MSKLLLLMASDEVVAHKRARKAAFEEEQMQRLAEFEETEMAIEEGKTTVLQAFCVAVENLNLHIAKAGEMADVRSQAVSVALGRDASAYPAIIGNIERPRFQSFFPKTIAVEAAGWSLKEEGRETWMDRDAELERALWADADTLHVKAVEYSVELVAKAKLDLAKNDSCVDFVKGLESPDMRLLRETARAIQCFQKLANVHNFGLSAY